MAGGCNKILVTKRNNNNNNNNNKTVKIEKVSQRIHSRYFSLPNMKYLLQKALKSKVYDNNWKSTFDKDARKSDSKGSSWSINL